MTIWNGLTSDGAVVPIQVDDEGRVVAVGSGPDSPLVVDGDYLRPRDATKGLGTANIDLDADGSANFAGRIDFGSGFIKDGVVSNGGIELSSGTFRVRQDGGNVCIAVFSGGDQPSNVVASISGNGSADFAGRVNLSSDSNTSNGAAIVNNSSSATLYGKNAKAGGTLLDFRDPSNTQKFVVLGDGSANFAGVVKAANIDLFLSPNDPTKVLDVKESIRSLQSALFRLKAAVLIPDQTVDDLRLKILEALENISEADE